MRGTVKMTFVDNGAFAEVDVTQVTAVAKLSAVLSLMQSLEFSESEIAAFQVMITGLSDTPVDIVVAGTGGQVKATQEFYSEVYVRAQEATKRALEAWDILRGCKGGNGDEH